MARNWRPKHAVFCPNCGWTGQRASVAKACPNCGHWHPKRGKPVAKKKLGRMLLGMVVSPLLTTQLLEHAQREASHYLNHKKKASN